MPIDYKKYPVNWKTEIVPAVRLRSGDRCENCQVPNKKLILRGNVNGIEVYQDEDGFIFDANTSERIGDDYVGEIDQTGKNRFILIILTVAHLNHDINDNSMENLKHLCQRCHNRHDKDNRIANRRKNTKQIHLPL